MHPLVRTFPVSTFKPVKAVLHGCMLLPELYGNKALVKHWLTGAHGAWLAALLVTAYLLFANQWLAGTLADWRYPPPKESLGKRIVQVFNPNVSHRHPLRDAQQRTFEQYGYWTLTLPLLLLIGALPGAVRSLEHKADGSTPDLATTQVRSDSERQTQAYLPEAELGQVGEGQRYQLERLLASGGAGLVYKGFDTRLQRPVAIKKLLGHLEQDPTMLARFKTEALSLAQLNHPNIVQVFDLFEDRGNQWLVMEWMTGGSLADRVHEHKKLDPQQALAIAQQVAEGLQLAHSEGIIHRDIKPDNILFDGRGQAKISDFGIARKCNNSQQTQVGLVIGSPGYMSPEQAAGELASPASDIYSLGVTLFEMLAGQLPFTGETTQVLLKHISQQPPQLQTQVPDLPDALCSLVDAMLAKAPEARPSELLQRIRSLRL